MTSVQYPEIYGHVVAIELAPGQPDVEWAFRDQLAGENVPIRDNDGLPAGSVRMHFADYSSGIPVGTKSRTFDAKTGEAVT